MNEMKGYKVFNPNWIRRKFQHQVEECYEINEKPMVHSRGFHFCKNLVDCYDSYDFNKENKVVEITAYGEIDTDEVNRKYCTNKIKIERELKWEEVLSIVNTGKSCIGLGNSGNFNIGDFNTGNCNEGNHNSGDSNNGDFNTGDFNNTNHSNGCFNTVEPNIYLFNKLSDWTLYDWRTSEAYKILQRIRQYPRDWNIKDMVTKEEMIQIRQKRWNQLDQREKEVVMSIPNFDKSIFKEITGIDVEGSDDSIFYEAESWGICNK